MSSTSSLARRVARAPKDEESPPSSSDGYREFESSSDANSSGSDNDGHVVVEDKPLIINDDETPSKVGMQKSYRYRQLVTSLHEYKSKYLSDKQRVAQHINIAALVSLLFLPAFVTYDIVLLVTRAAKASTYLALVFHLALSVLCLLRGCKSRKHGTITFLVGLLLALYTLKSLVFTSTSFLSQPFPTIEVDRASPRVAIIGAGPSGMGALFALKVGAASRDVTMFEATSHIGGHATTVHHDGHDIDIGFIFSSGNYWAYEALLERYGMTRNPTSLSVQYHGSDDGSKQHADNDAGRGGVRGDTSHYPSWHNMGNAPTSPSLQAEIDRFQSYVESPPTMLRMLMPLGIWLKVVARFSDDFMESVLRPLLTPLFVTARGCMFQSTQGTLNYFRTKTRGGFLSINLDKYKGNVSMPVYHAVDGAVTLHENILEETKLPESKLHLNTAVTSVSRTRSGKWRVKARPTSGLPGGRCYAKRENDNTECLATGTTVDPPNGAGESIDEEFDQVIMATSAKIASKILVPSAGTHGAAWVLNNIDYDDFRVTLSLADDKDAVKTEKALYHVYPNGRLSGSIDRILEVGGGLYKLEVEPDSNPERPAKHYGSEILATRKWHHHRFSLWELLLTHRVLPRFNHVQGLHIAGDFIRGYGHDDALSSGIMAACKAGISAKAKETLEEMKLGFLCNEIKE